MIINNSRVAVSWLEQVSELTSYIYLCLLHVDIQVADNFVSPLLDAVLLDYQRNVASAREPEVLSTMAVIVDKLDVSY